MSFARTRTALLLAGLVGLSSLIQVLVIARAVTTELDTLRYVTTAQAIEEQGLVPVLQTTSEQPLYPVAIWLVHETLQRTVGEFRTIWVLSAQIAAAIPLVLAVVPVYFLSVRLVGRAAALAGALIFCVLPEVCRLGGDGISDSTHLLFLCLAMWAVVVYLTGSDEFGPLRATAGPSKSRALQSPLWLLVAGLAVGMATLARMEVLILPVALLPVLGLRQAFTRYRQPWLRLATAIGCLAIGISFVLGPYLLIVETTTPRVAVARILGHYRPQPPAKPSPPHAATAILPLTDLQLADGQPMSFARRDPSIQIRQRGTAAVAELCGQELADAFGYWIGPFALLGLWWLRRTLVRPVDWFDFLFIALFSLASVWFASREGYLCSRHLLAIVVLGIGCAGHGLLESGHWLGEQLLRITKGTPRMPPLLCSALPWLVVGAACMICLQESSKPLNRVHLCHRQAAEWLAHEADVTGSVLDTWSLTGLYSGRKTTLYTEAPTVLSNPELAYAVVESRELEFSTSRSHTLRTLLGAAAEPVASFTTPLTDRGQRTVLVYRWHPERFAAWLTRPSLRSLEVPNNHAQARSVGHPERR